MYTWKPEMSVGHLSLDDDHKAFFSLAGLLHDAALQGGQKMVVDSAISLLQEYIVGHFMREEMAMLSAQYPDVETHIKAHAEFSRTVNALIGDYQQSVSGAADKLAETTAQWLIVHIANVDTKYSNWIKETDLDNRPLGLLAGVPDDGDDDDLWGL